MLGNFMAKEVSQDMTEERKNIILEKLDGGVARVIINRPEKRNILDVDTVFEFATAFEEIRKDNSIAVVITTGAGDTAWSAGRDTRYLLGAFENPEEAPRLPDIFEIVRNFPKVTMAAVNGYCLGGALSLYISHDLGIASEEKAFFGLPEIIRGFVPKSVVATVFRSMHPKWGFDMLLTGRNFDAKTAKMAGLISRIAPHEQLQEAAYDWAKEIAQWDKVTLQYCKRAAYECMDQLTYDQALAVNSYVWAEEGKVNPKSRQGLRDFIAGKGIKADK
jgi:enoyl-CoA hydratase/carnithine racemase